MSVRLSIKIVEEIAMLAGAYDICQHCGGERMIEFNKESAYLVCDKCCSISEFVYEEIKQNGK